MILLLCLLGASVFNVNGLGEDRSVFYVPFSGRLEKAQIEFAIRPEYTLISSGGDSRGLFWFNPFRISLRLPVTKTLVVSLGNEERFNQAADVYLQRDQLDLRYRSQGGTEELRAHGHLLLPIAELCAGGSFLFGGSREIWDYDISNYTDTDTFQYRWSGWAFRAGLSVGLVFAAYEGLGRLTMTSGSEADSSGDLPGRLTAGIRPVFGSYAVTLVYEHAWWPDDDPVSRLRAGVSRGRFHCLYSYNPWYIDGITEHGLQCGYCYPVKNLGSVGLILNAGYRTRGDLAELDLRPEFRITFEELFSRREK